MARKLPLAELSIVVDGDIELPTVLANSGYRDEWHAKTFDDTLLALAGRLLPDGTRLDEPCSNWTRAFGTNEIFPHAEPLIGLSRDQLCRGEHWLAIGTATELREWVECCVPLLREKQLGWLTLYSRDGAVRQWNRAALRRWFTI